MAGVTSGVHAARGAAITTWVQALAFGLPAVPVSVFVLREHRLPWLWGLFPMYGGPWSEAMDEWQLVLALWLFLLVSLLASYGAWLLWHRHRSGAAMAAILLPVEAVFWWGFALPFPVLGGVLRAALIAIAWPQLATRDAEKTPTPNMHGTRSVAADIAFRIGAAPLAFFALGFGIPAVIGAEHFARTGGVWTLWGYPTYAPDVFERWGVRVDPVALMVAFAVVCALAAAASVLLCIPATATIGAVAGLLLIAAQAVFWIGFLLPFGPPGGLLAAVAIIVGLALRWRASAGTIA